MNKKMDILALSAAGLTLLFWASAFAGIRVGLSAYSPGQMALLRFLVASLVLAGYAVYKRLRLPELRDLPLIAVCGLLGISIYHTSLNYGEITVSAGAASFLISLSPIFTALLAVTFLGERLPAIGWAGMTISLLGAALISWGVGEGIRFEAGSLLVLLSAVCTSIFFVIQKPLLTRYQPFEFTTYALWAGTLGLLVFLPGLPSAVLEAAPEVTGAVVYLGVFPAALAYVSWSYVLSRLPASRAVSLLYLSPPLATVIALVWLGEVPNHYTLSGGLLALVGVILVNQGVGRSGKRMAGRASGNDRCSVPMQPEKALEDIKEEG